MLRILLLTAVFTAACSDPTCKHLGRANDAFKQHRGECGTGGIKLTEESCDDAISSCNDIDHQALDNMATCVERLPDCNPEQKDDWTLKVVGCGFKLLPMGDECRDAFDRAAPPTQTADTSPDGGSEPPDAGTGTVDPDPTTAVVHLRVRNEFGPGAFWLSYTLDGTTHPVLVGKTLALHAVQDSPLEIEAPTGKNMGYTLEFSAEGSSGRTTMPGSHALDRDGTLEFIVTQPVSHTIDLQVRWEGEGGGTTETPDAGTTPQCRAAHASCGTDASCCSQVCCAGTCCAGSCIYNGPGGGTYCQ